MSKKRTISERTCVVSRERTSKEDLIRVVRHNNGAVKVDWQQQLGGRGAYIKGELDLIEKAKKRNAFARALRTKVDEAVYDELAGGLNDNSQNE